ncbi:hypothetical protein [Roseicyclus amphidinii]|uniref:hypothetical protein n=1 Tax=Roseicyclus amphidinii TaxID=3034232 RepID=UPI0024E089DA|nr:hypothetical protein [Roseicyclus sp. Amp-Y-6]
MTRTRPPQVAFSSGEISPQLNQRFDYRKYQTGLRVCRGFLPTRQGPVTRAPGTWYRGTTRNNAVARRIRFEFAEDDALELEFTDRAMRVWRYGALVMDGASPFELVTPFLEADLPRLSVVQSADVIYIADGQRPIQRLRRLALDNWDIGPFVPDDGPFRVFNTDEAHTIQASATTGTGITLTASTDTFEADHVGSLIRLEPIDFSDVPGWTGETDFRIGDKVRYAGNTYQLVATPGTTQTTGNTVNVGPAVPQHLSGTQQVSKNVSWKHLSGSFGIVRITAIVSPTQATATVLAPLPDGVVDDPTYLWSEGAWSDRHGYPSVLELHEQRLIAAATTRDPRTIFFSAAGTTEVFDEGEDATDAFGYTIGGSSSINRILWLRSGNRGLYIGALGQELSTASTDGNAALGPTTLTFRPGSEIGSIPARPISFSGNPIFIAKDGRRVFEIEYSYERDRNVPLEISLPSNHLGAPGLLQIEQQMSPEPLIWLRRADGNAVICLYDRSEDVLGWCVLPVAGGVIEDIAVTPAPDGGPDIVSAIVRRTLGGEVRRCVEEFGLIYGLQPSPPPLHEAHHLYCASRFELEVAATTFSVPHLAGQSVYAWTDAGQYGPLTVAGDGTVTLEAAVTRATIGLFDDTHLVETLPVIPASPEGSTIGRAQKLNADLGLAVQNTADGWVETYSERLGQPRQTSGQRDILLLQVASDLTQVFTGTTRLPGVSGQGTQVGVRIGPRGGAPMTIAGLAPGIEEAGA